MPRTKARPATSPTPPPAPALLTAAPPEWELVAAAERTGIPARRLAFLLHLIDTGRIVREGPLP